jgi:hypothetical protein
MSRILYSATASLVMLFSSACLGTDAHGLPTGQVTHQQVLSRPEAHLYYPGAQVMESHGEAEIPSLLEGNRPAYVETYLVVSDTPRQRIDEWYATKLTAAGWHLDSRTEPNVSYSKDTRESFTIWYFKVAPPGINWDGKGTLYSIGYQIAPCSQAGVSC